MLRVVIFTAFVLGIITSYGQILRDTSYTLSSAFVKLQKYYPDVSIPKVDRPDHISIEENVAYQSYGKRVLLADLYVNSSGKKPCIVLIHGGGWRSGNKELMRNMAIRLATEGYTIVVPEYRLSPEAAYPAAVHDIKAAIRWVRQHAGKLSITSDKVAILGCSAGGQLAALVGTTNNKATYEGIESPASSSAVQAIIDIDGVLAFKHPDSKEGRMAAEWLGGHYDEVAGNWEQASALTHVSKSTPPTMFIGSMYPRFLAGHNEFMKGLDEFNIPHVMVKITGAPHSFWLVDPWFDQTINYVTIFLKLIFKDEKFN